MFYIDVEPSAVNKKIYNLKYFNHAVVRVEGYLKTATTPNIIHVKMLDAQSLLAQASQTC